MSETCLFLEAFKVRILCANGVDVARFDSGTQTTRSEPPFTEVCLVDSLRALGFKVPYLGHGPFWAMQDGNAMLKPFQHLGCH